MITRKVRHKNEDGTVVETDIGALAGNVEENEQRRFVSDEEKEKWNKGTQLIMVSLPASGWTENDAGLFAQTVSIENLKETDSAVMYGYMAPDITENDSDAYWKNYEKISGGQAADGSMTFYAAENPGSDLTVYLSMGKSGDGRLILSGGSAGGEAGTGVSNVIITLTDNAAVAEGGTVTAACNGKTWQSTIKNGRARLYTSEVGTYTITVKAANESGEEVTYTTMLVCPYFGQFSTDIYSGTLAVTCTEEGGNGKSCNVRSCDDEYNPTNTYNLTQTFDSTLKLTFLGIPAGKYLVTVDDKYVFFKEIASIQNINSVEVELKQWLFKDGDHCVWNTGGWIKCQVAHSSCHNANYYDGTKTYTSQSASAAAEIRAASLYIKASAIAQKYQLSQWQYRGGAYATANIGTIKPLPISINKYSAIKCTASGTSRKPAACFRVGDPNAEDTNVATATVLSSGDMDLDINIAENYPSLVIGCRYGNENYLTGTTVNAISDSCEAEITEIWMV